jgi:hypothetical protein
MFIQGPANRPPVFQKAVTNKQRKIQNIRLLFVNNKYDAILHYLVLKIMSGKCMTSQPMRNCSTHKSIPDSSPCFSYKMAFHTSIECDKS